MSGCSGNVLRVSIRSLAGTAIELSSFDSISNSAERVVSKSDAVITSLLLDISNKK